MVEEAAEILEGVDDVPFGEGEVGIVLLAAIARLVDRRQHLAWCGERRNAASGAATAFDGGQRRKHGQRDQDREDGEDAPQALKHAPATRVRGAST